MRIKIRKSDKMFSEFIRMRDSHTCQRCLKKYTPPYGASLQCSHWQRRGKENTRFDTENCISLCFGCHKIWEGPTEEYTEFMRKRLGEKGLKHLRVRAEIYKKRDDKMDELVVSQLFANTKHGSIHNRNSFNLGK